MFEGTRAALPIPNDIENVGECVLERAPHVYRIQLSDAGVLRALVDVCFEKKLDWTSVSNSI